MPSIVTRSSDHQTFVCDVVAKKAKEACQQGSDFPSVQRCSEWVAKADSKWCKKHNFQHQSWSLYDKSNQVHVLKAALQQRGLDSYLWVASGSSQASMHFKPEGVDHIQRIASIQPDCGQLYSTDGIHSRTSAMFIVIVAEKSCGKSTLLQNDCDYARVRGYVTYVVFIQCSGASPDASESGDDDSDGSTEPIIVSSVCELLTVLKDVVAQYDAVFDAYVKLNPDWKTTKVVGGVEQYVNKHPPPGLYVALDDITKLMVGATASATRGVKEALGQLSAFLVGQSQDSRHRQKHFRITTHDLDMLMRKFALPPGIVDVVLFNVKGSSIFSPTRTTLPQVTTCKEDPILKVASTTFGVESAMLTQVVMVHSWAQAARLAQAQKERASAKLPWPVFTAAKHPCLTGRFVVPTKKNRPAELPAVINLRPVVPVSYGADDVTDSDVNT